MKQFERVVQQLCRDIDTGLFVPGEKLPGVRKLSRRFDVSVSTVVHAHRILEDQGYIEPVSKSGFYVKSTVAAASPQLTASVRRPLVVEGGDFLADFLLDGMRPGMLKMGTAVPDGTFLPTAALHKHFARALHDLASYHFPPGHEGLRRQIARRMLSAGCQIHPDQVLITNGAQEAIGLCLKVLTKPGDVIAVESPVYYGLLNAFESLRLKAIEIPTDPATGIVLDELQAAIHKWPIKACLLVPHHHNPLGHAMPPARIKALLRLLEQHDIALIEDDVYGDLGFSPKRPPAIKSYDKKNRVLYCSSFSKTIAPGLRIGWLVAPDYMEQLQHEKFLLNHACPGPNQAAIAAYLSRGGHERYLRKVRATYSRQVQVFSRCILEHFPADTRVTRPSGGFVLWVELPEGSVDMRRVYAAAVEEKIWFAPGFMFSTRGRFNTCLRLSCAVPWSSQVARRLMKLGQIIKTMGRD